jgi:hypothetical protein
MGEMAKQEPFSSISTGAQDLGEHAKESAAGVVDHTKEVIQSEAQRSAGQLGDVANALRRSSQDLDGSPAAQYVNKAAEQIDRVARYVRTANVDELRDTVESFARREPLLFLGGAFALGMIGARFLKSSAHHGPRRS